MHCSLATIVKLHRLMIFQIQPANPGDSHRKSHPARSDETPFRKLRHFGASLRNARNAPCEVSHGSLTVPGHWSSAETPQGSPGSGRSAFEWFRSWQFGQRYPSSADGWHWCSSFAMLSRAFNRCSPKFHAFHAARTAGNHGTYQDMTTRHDNTTHLIWRLVVLPVSSEAGDSQLDGDGHRNVARPGGPGQEVFRGRAVNWVISCWGFEILG